MSNVAFLVTPQNVTISRDGKTLMINKQYADFNGVVDKLKKRDLDGAFELADRAVSLAKSSKGVFTVQGGIVYRDGVPVHNVVTDRIMQFQDEGLPFEPLLKFLENLMQNPSERSITELYKFLEHQYLPITEDGCFLAYKGVQGNYFSVTSGDRPVQVSRNGGKTWESVTGKVPNIVGSILKMDRKDVNPNQNVTCSFGLHAGALTYAEGFKPSDGKMVVVKINPRDAVSVPTDSNAEKLRVCQYEVVAEYEKPFLKPMEKTTLPKVKASKKAEVRKNMTFEAVTKLYRALTKTDVKSAIAIFQKAAEKHLKLRFRTVDGERIYSQVTGDATIDGEKLTINLTIPLDPRYKQPDPTEFTVAWQQAVEKRFSPKSALLK